jgi:single-stranded DNA-binding protein
MDTPTNTKPKPEIKGKVIAVGENWTNNAGTFTKREVIIETGLRYTNPLKVTFKNDKTSLLEDLKEGDCVIVTYQLDGRAWDGPDGVRYFVDIVGNSLQKIVGGGAAAKTASSKPVVGCTVDTAKEEWAKNHGDDKTAFAEFCKRLKPGKPSKEYTIADWADVVNAIRREDEATADAGVDNPDDLPF